MAEMADCISSLARNYPDGYSGSSAGVVMVVWIGSKLKNRYSWYAEQAKIVPPRGDHFEKVP
jgi:hypothetical protein